MQLFCLILPSMLALASALDNGLAQTPPMGWLSWLFNYCEVDCENHPKKCLSEQLIKRIADRMAADGYRNAGYEYIIIDDCWEEWNRENGKMVPDKKRFKSGIRALSDYVHSKGLKFGMYQDIGNKTCAGYPGLKGYEKEDADTFAEWQIDYLKVDGCNDGNDGNFSVDYPKFGKILNETGRPILYSCSWPAYSSNPNYTLIAKYCNGWRNYDDIYADWGTVSKIMDWFGNHSEFADTAGPGHFHDADMLVIGYSEITKDQARVQMAVWSILAGPLLMSTDLDTIKPEFKEILLNKDIIAVSQCKMGKMGKRIHKSGHLQVWKRIYSEGIAIALVNTGNQTEQYTFTIKDLELDLDDVPYKVIDFYKEDKDQLLPKNGKLDVKINPTGVKFYRFVPKGGKQMD